MKNIKIKWNVGAALATLSIAPTLLAGCGGAAFNTVAAPVTIQGTSLQGNVHGGQQPVSGAAIALYAASTAGYAAPTTNLLTQAVSTSAGGSFSITGDYTCTAGQQMYLVATGGNPGNAGGTINPNLALMVALGDCAQLSQLTYVNINEVTTVATGFALAPFMGTITAAGTDATNTSGLAHAFGSVNKLVNIASGVTPGTALPAGATAPTSEIDTLADVLAGCINSMGGTAGDNSACGMLFTLAAPSGGAAPTDTIQAVLNIAHHPTRNVAALYNLSAPTAPFNPQLTSAPQDWTMAVSYTVGGALNAPKTTTVDRAGNIWIANAGNNSVTALAQTGASLSGSPFTGNGLAAPSAIAIDIGGNAWVANGGGNTVSVFTSSGAALNGSPFAGAGTIHAPSSIAMDAPGNVWIANSATSTITELTSAGTYIQQVSQSISAPASLAIDPK